MRAYLVNLLIAFAMGLCGLCTYQWYRETLTRRHIDQLDQTIFERNRDIQNYTNSIKSMDHQIAQLDTRVAELKETVRTNEATMLQQRREIGRLEASNDGLTRQLEQYTNAVAELQKRLQDAYDGIRRQNETVSNLVAQRDEYVGRLNTAIKERNDIVNQYNEIVERVKKMQEEAAQPKGGAAQKGTAK